MFISFNASCILYLLSLPCYLDFWRGVKRKPESGRRYIRPESHIVHALEGLFHCCDFLTIHRRAGAARKSRLGKPACTISDVFLHIVENFERSSEGEKPGITPTLNP